MASGRVVFGPASCYHHLDKIMKLNGLKRAILYYYITDGITQGLMNRPVQVVKDTIRSLSAERPSGLVSWSETVTGR